MPALGTHDLAPKISDKHQIASFNTGKMPGVALSKLETKLFGATSSKMCELENNFFFEAICAWISRPTIVSHPEAEEYPRKRQIFRIPKYITLSPGSDHYFFLYQIQSKSS